MVLRARRADRAVPQTAARRWLRTLWTPIALLIALLGVVLPAPPLQIRLRQAASLYGRLVVGAPTDRPLLPGSVSELVPMGPAAAQPYLGAVNSHVMAFASAADPGYRLVQLPTVFAVFVVPRTPRGGFAYAAGTAFFISQDGLALTNSHVVHEAHVNPGYELIAVVAREWYGADVTCASVLQIDPWTEPNALVDPGRDVAEIRLTSPPAFPYRVFTLPDGTPYATPHRGPAPMFPSMTLAAEPAVGDAVHFAGFGSTLGANPVLTWNAGTVRQFYNTIDGTRLFYIDLDGDVIKGDSGSPVLDAQNQVVGLLAWNSGNHVGLAMTRSAFDPACP